MNGELVFLGDRHLQKFRTLIRCKDKAPPAFEGLWRGDKAEVGCIQELSQKAEATDKTICLSRQSVLHSTRAYDSQGNAMGFTQNGEEVALLHSCSSIWFVSYRPLLTMIVTHFQLETDEWGMASGWSLSLEEV